MASISAITTSLARKPMLDSLICVAACSTPTPRPTINSPSSKGPVVLVQIKRQFSTISTAESMVTRHPLPVEPRRSLASRVALEQRSCQQVPAVDQYEQE